MGLLGPDGAPLPTRLAGENAAQPGTRTLLLEGAEQSFIFEDVPAPPVPSLLRGFSAPVRLRGVSRDRLRFLAVHDTDPFVRWESGLQYAASVMLEMVAAQQRGEPLGFDDALAEAVANTLAGADADPAFAAEALSLPGEGFLADQMEIADPVAIHAVRHHLRAEIGRRCKSALRGTYDALADSGSYRIDGTAIGRRALRNTCLAYLTAAGDALLAKAQFDTATNMTDSLAALSLLADTDCPARDAALTAFHARWHGDDLVLDKWFSIQAMAARPDAIAAVRALYVHPDFDLKNPNRARSLIGAFASGNPSQFHDLSGEGYRFLADAVIALDPINGSIAARLIGPLGQWRRQSAARGTLMRRELQRVLDTPDLSKGTFEKASKALL
jgi:aminopeptidase N